MESSKNIIVNLIGGLGNQLFQYALGYVICKENGQNLLVDTTGFQTYKVRNLELDKFNLELNYAPIELIEKLNKKTFFHKTLFKEKNFTFNRKMLKIKGNAYIKGYWQTEKYFEKYKNDIRKIFTFKDFSFIKNHNLLEEIKSTNSVSINLRLCEYVKNPEIAKIHYVCKENYYKNAIEYINQTIENSKFFVFSDDIEMAKEFLPKDTEYTYCNTANWQEDLFFMQNAKHNIVANSSFSWWAAWLNQNPQKIVLAPNEWFTKAAKINYKDVVPDLWKKIKV